MTSLLPRINSEGGDTINQEREHRLIKELLVSRKLFVAFSFGYV